MFKKRSNSARLAIAVRDDSIFAVQRGKRVHTEVSLKAWSAISLEKGIIQKGKLIKPRLFEQALQELLKNPSHGVFTESNCHFVLPEELVQHHIATVKTPNTDFSPAIFNQAMLNLIHRQVETRKMHGSMDQDLSTWVHSSYSFAEKDYQRYFDACKEIGLTIQTYSSSAQAASAFYFMGGKSAEPLLWIHLGQDQTDFALMDAYGIYQSETIASGVNQLVQALQIKAGLTLEQVGLVLQHFGSRIHGSKQEKVIKQVFHNWLKEMTQDARQLKTLSSLHHDKNLALLICGEGSLIPGVGEYFSTQLNLDLRVSRSWAQFFPALEIKKYHQLIPALGAIIE